MAKQLGLAALPEELSSIPAPTQWLSTGCNSSYRRSGVFCLHMCQAETYMQAKYSMHINKLQLKEQKKIAGGKLSGRALARHHPSSVTGSHKQKPKHIHTAHQLL